MNDITAVVFSDLDGTLIDHETYSYAAAEEGLSYLRQNGIPLVLSSSKTAAEIIPLRRALGFEDSPAICENGAGLVEAGAKGASEATDYTRIRRIIGQTPEHLQGQYRGFGDMSLEELVAATGLSEDSAKLAQAREFSEPGLWSGSESAKAEFLDALAGAGVVATQGGRFLTLSFGATKADRMAEILARYGYPSSVALGDAPNDIEMVEAADFGVIVANPAHAPLPALAGEADGRIIRTEKVGPAGWSEAVMRIVSRLDIQR